MIFNLNAGHPSWLKVQATMIMNCVNSATKKIIDYANSNKTGRIEIFMFGNLTKNELRTSLESLFIEFSVNVIVSVKCSC
jgi:hypothetical protein